MPNEDPRRVGLIGLGTIGGAIARTITDGDGATLDFVMTRSPRSSGQVPEGAEALTEISALDQRSVDLIVEAVDGDFVYQHALAILDHADFMPFSLTSLSDDSFRERVRAKCAEKGRRLYVPHGAILGLDGIYDGRAVIESIEITTTKHPRNLGLEESREGTLFDGTVREACRKFPRNVNVHAAVALAGLGFDDTHSRVIADPSSTRMRHEILVQGAGLAWTITVESQAVGSVTGSYTPESAANTVQRVIGGARDIVLA